MSLLCNECGNDLQPSKELPGREGGMLHPNIPAFAWTEDPTQWVRTCVQAPDHRAVCLECIVGRLPPTQVALWANVFAAYVLEFKLSEIQKEQTGKWIAPSDNRWNKAFKAFREARDRIETKCLCCGDDASPSASFTLMLIDRHKSGPGMFAASYQMTTVATGMISLTICFGCCKRILPRTFRQLGNDLRGTGETNLNMTSTIEFSPEFVEHMQKNMQH